MWRPSGEMKGLKSEGPSVSGCATPPSGDARQMRPFHSNAKNDPSGASDGEDARNISDQSRWGSPPAHAAKVAAATHAAAASFLNSRVFDVFMAMNYTTNLASWIEPGR